jgi:hypothetical protein
MNWLGGFLCFALVSTLLPPLSGFIPSAWWIASSWYIALSVGLLTGVLGLFLILLGLRFKTEEELGPNSIGLALTVVFGLFMCCFSGFAAVTAGLPFVYTLFLGSGYELPYIVNRASQDESGRGGGRCAQPVTLKNLPDFIDMLCHFPFEERDGLQAGSEITVTGRGTFMGIFPQHIRANDAGQQ